MMGYACGMVRWLLILGLLGGCAEVGALGRGLGEAYPPPSPQTSSPPQPTRFCIDDSGCFPNEVCVATTYGGDRYCALRP